MAICARSLSRFTLTMAIAALGAASYTSGAMAYDMNPQEQAAYRPFQLLLDGLAQFDGSLMRAQLLPSFHATLMRERKPLELDIDGFLGRLPKSGPPKILEQVHDPVVKVDDNVAVIWAPYVFYTDGKQHHCGTNVVNLVNIDGKWLISSVADTARPTCKQR